MKLPRASMTTTLFVILVFAVDFGVARHLLLEGRGMARGVGLGLMPMATALAFVLYHVLRLRGRVLPFTLGFEVAGVASTAALACLMTREPLPEAASRTLGAIAAITERGMLALVPLAWLQREYKGLFELLEVAVIYTLSPLLVALAGGGAARLIGRRSARVA